MFPNEHYNQDLPSLGGNGNSIPLGNRPCNFRDLNSLGDILLKYNEGHSIRPHIGMFHSYIGHEGCNEDHNLVPRIYGLANRFRKHKPYPRIWNANEGPILDFSLFYNFTSSLYVFEKNHLIIHSLFFQQRICFFKSQEIVMEPSFVIGHEAGEDITDTSSFFK